MENYMQLLSRLPREILRDVIYPKIRLALTDNTIRYGVQDYLAGGNRKQRIVAKYGEISNWDTSRVTNMSWLFNPTTSFNQPLNKWDVSNVTNMEGMFNRATSFNQPLNDWDVSNVQNMQLMFYQARSFNQPLNDWDVSKVENMKLMFQHATFFNQPLNEWNVSNVKKMNHMFSFEQGLHAPWYCEQGFVAPFYRKYRQIYAAARAEGLGCRAAMRRAVDAYPPK